MDRDSERGAIGGTSSMGSDDSKFHYNTPAVQLGNAIRDGDEFVLFVRSKQGQGYQVWSSSDKTATPNILKQATDQLGLTPQTA